MAIAQTMAEIPGQGMEIIADAGNPPATIIAIPEATGEAEVMKAAIAEEWVQIQDMELNKVSQATEIVQEAIGEVVAARAVHAVAAVILMISIWVEVDQDAMMMTMIVPEEAAEVVDRAWDEAILALQAGAVDVATIGNLFRNTIIKR
jgi:hypothetical protein